jgi:hypothetical protein
MCARASLVVHVACAKGPFFVLLVHLVVQMVVIGRFTFVGLPAKQHGTADRHTFVCVIWLSCSRSARFTVQALYLP